MKLADLVFRLTPGGVPTPSDAEARAALRRIIKKCPVCELDLAQHATAEIATIIATNEDGHAAAEDAAARGAWSQLMQFHEWDADADVISFNAIRCSRRESLGLIKILFTAEMWADDTVQETRPLDAQQSTELGSLIADRWNPL